MSDVLDAQVINDPDEDRARSWLCLVAHRWSRWRTIIVERPIMRLSLLSAYGGGGQLTGQTYQCRAQVRHCRGCNERQEKDVP